MNSRPLDRRRGDGENRCRRKNQSERCVVSARVIEGGRAPDPAGEDREPGQAAKTGEEAAGECEVCGCDEWQLAPGRALPNARSLPRLTRNHSVCRAIKAGDYTASGSAGRLLTTRPRKVEPVVPVSWTVRYCPISEASPGIMTTLKFRVRD